MLFKSPISMMVVNVIKEVPDWHPATGTYMGVKQRRVAAEFGQAGQEYDYHNPLTGQADKTVDIVGNYFDTDAEAERNDWTSDEKESVEKRLMACTREIPQWVQLVERVAPIPDKPWASYNSMHAQKIAKIAIELGVIDEALAYERATKNRPEVIGMLEVQLENERSEMAMTAIEEEM